MQDDNVMIQRILKEIIKKKKEEIKIKENIN